KLNTARRAWRARSYLGSECSPFCGNGLRSPRCTSVALARHVNSLEASSTGAAHISNRRETIMSLKHFTLTAMLATMGFFFGGAPLFGTTAKAEGRLDDLSHRLIGELGQLEQEYRETFRGREFMAGLNDLREMTAVANHLHEGLHHSEPGRHARADAEKLDE